MSVYNMHFSQDAYPAGTVTSSGPYIDNFKIWGLLYSSGHHDNSSYIGINLAPAYEGEWTKL